MNAYDTVNAKTEFNGCGFIHFVTTPVKETSDGTCPECGAPAGSNCYCWEEK